MVRMRLALAVLASMALSFSPARAADDGALTRSDVETIVREYLIANPEVLEEAFSALQEKRLAAANEERAMALASLRPQLETSPYGAVLGNPDGDVTLVEFFDYNCGYCKRALDDLERLVETDPNLRVVMKEFPVLGEASMKAAAVSIAVHQVAPEAYDEFHRSLLGTQGRVDDAAAFRVVEELGLPKKEIETAMASDVVRKTIEESYGMAQALKIEGTPSYVIGDAVEQGAVGFDTLQNQINVVRCGEPTC